MDENETNALKSQAEKHLWDYLRRQVEKSGNPDASSYLTHFLMAKPLDPMVRGDIRLVPFEMYHRVSDYSTQLFAKDGTVLSWYFELLAEQGGKDLPVEKALEAAQAEAKPPKEAVLRKSAYETVAGAPVFIARWEHEENGIPVEKDYIHVQVNGKSGRPFALNRRWHALDFKPTER
jgi:hypothetical protein